MKCLRSKKRLNSLIITTAGRVLYPRILFLNIENVAAARGLHRMSAIIMVRLTETTLRSQCRCFSTMKLQRTSMCLLRLRKRFSFERATADSQSSYDGGVGLCEPELIGELAQEYCFLRDVRECNHFAFNDIECNQWRFCAAP
jgi:hypothetical protein